MDRKHSAQNLDTSLALPVPPKKTFTKVPKVFTSPVKIFAPLKPFSPKTPLNSPSQPSHQTILDSVPMNPNGRVPTLHVQRASGGIEDPFINHATAKWECCVCGTKNHVYIHPGQHPLGALICDCPHKPCSMCTTTGVVKPFLPIEEPAMVPCGDADDAGAPTTEGEKAKELRFGIVCPSCGLSWRAREFGKRISKTLRKMPSMSLNHAVRLAPVEGKLRKTRSTLVLGNKRIVTPPGTEMPKQAEYAAVRFSGITCTCGSVISLKSAFCFQIVEAQVDEREKEFWGLWVSEGNSVGWSTTPGLVEKGHGTPVLRFGMGKMEHPNPLRSCPVVDKIARESWEEKCDKEGWV